MKKFILMFAAVAALMMSCQTEEEKAGSLSGEGYQFDFTIAAGGFDTATKGDATVGWTAGEKVYVFFKPDGGELLGDSYAEFTYTGSDWDPESYVAPGALGSSGKMAAVYVPYFSGKSPVYAGGKWTFDSGDVYYSCASGADYTVEGGTVTGTLDMTIPDGYVQFSIASAAEGDVLACNMVDGYEKVTLTSDLAFSTSTVIGKKMKGHADNGKTYFWGMVNGATATECEFTLTTKAGDMVLKVPAENVLKNNAFNIASSFAPAVSVTFVNPEGDVISTMPATQYILKGSKATKPTAPTDQTTNGLGSGFHTLEGWYKTKDATTGELSDKWDFSTDVVTENINLYAQWKTTIGKIIGKAANPFPFYNQKEYTNAPSYQQDNNTWVCGEDKIFYGAKDSDDESQAIFIRQTYNGGTRVTQTYYS